MKENSPFTYLGQMENFHSIYEKVSLFTEPDWVKYSERKVGIAAENSDTIPLMYDPKNIFNSFTKHALYEEFETFISEVLSMYPEKIHPQQAMFTRMRAGAKIGRHKDKGPVTFRTHRIHVPITTNPECIFTVEEEERNLKPGEVWVIDNVDKYHSVRNLGTTSRIHLIIDAI
jgi:hypothetical protein